MRATKALAIALLCFAVGACASSMGSPASSSALPTSQPPDATFPSEIAGLPVISGGGRRELLQSGRLDGEAVAVAGYFDEFTPPCPYPGSVNRPARKLVRIVAFTDTHSAAAHGASRRPDREPQLLSAIGNEPGALLHDRDQRQPVVVAARRPDPNRMPWSSSATPATPGNGNAPRWSRLSARARSSWTGSRGPPGRTSQRRSETGDRQAGRRHDQDDAGTGRDRIGLGDDLLTAAPFRAGDVATVDPRWNLAGDNLVWLVRSVGPAARAGFAGDPAGDRLARRRRHRARSSTAMP